MEMMPLENTNTSWDPALSATSLATNATGLARKNCSGYYDILRRLPDYQAQVTAACFVYIYLGCPLVLQGIVGNILSFIVLQKDRRSTTTYLLQALAIADLVHLIILIFAYNYSGATTCFYLEESGGNELFVDTQRYVFPAARMVQTIGNWIVVVVSFDRFMWICHPASANQYCTIPRVKMLIRVIVVISILVDIPMFFESVKTRRVDGCTGQVYIKGDYADFYHSIPYAFIYNTLFQGLLRLLAPVTILCYLNTKLILRLKRAAKKRMEFGSSRVNQIPDYSITIVLIVVVIVFIVCQTPFLLYVILSGVEEVTPGTLGMTYIFITFLFHAANFMLVLNSSVNFIIYVMLGRRFRAILLRMVACSSGADNPDAVCLQNQTRSQTETMILTGANSTVNWLPLKKS